MPVETVGIITNASDPTTVIGRERRGIAIPTPEPKSAMDSSRENPLEIRRKGTAIATKELITLLAARDTVMGVEDLSSGIICPLGLFSLPFMAKKQRITPTMLTKQPNESDKAVM